MLISFFNLNRSKFCAKNLVKLLHSGSSQGNKTVLPSNKFESKSKYDIISFVDDDNFIPPNWVEYQYKTFLNPEIGILGCTSIGHFDFQIPLWYEKEKLNFATGALYSCSLCDITPDGAVYGAGMTLRKEIYSNLFSKNWQPFLTGRIGKTQMGGEDSELTFAARLLGYKI